MEPQTNDVRNMTVQVARDVVCIYVVWIDENNEKRRLAIDCATLKTALEQFAPSTREALEELLSKASA